MQSPGLKLFGDVNIQSYEAWGQSMEMDGHYAQNSGKLQMSKTASQDASIVHIFNN